MKPTFAVMEKDLLLAIDQFAATPTMPRQQRKRVLVESEAIFRLNLELSRRSGFVVLIGALAPEQFGPYVDT